MPYVNGTKIAPIKIIIQPRAWLKSFLRYRSLHPQIGHTEKFKSFLEKIGVLNKIEFDIEEVGQPLKFNWGKCKLATASFGHGITTTPLQLAKGYSIITNGGYDIKPTLIKTDVRNITKKRKR